MTPRPHDDICSATRASFPLGLLCALSCWGRIPRHLEQQETTDVTWTARKCGMARLGSDIKETETLSKEKENHFSVVFTALCKSRDSLFSFNAKTEAGSSVTFLLQPSHPIHSPLPSPLPLSFSPSSPLPSPPLLRFPSPPLPFPLFSPFPPPPSPLPSAKLTSPALH